MAVRPFDMVHRSLQKEVLVTMKNGGVFQGRMESYDENLNLFLSDAKGDDERQFKSIVLKGGNIVSIQAVLSKG